MSLKDKRTTMNINEVFNTPKGKGIAAGLLLVLVVLVIAGISMLGVPKHDGEDTDKVVINETTETPVVSEIATDTPAAATSTETAKANTETVASITETVVTEYDLSGYKDPFKPFAAAAIDNGIATDGSSAGSTSSTSSSNQTTISNSDVPNSLSLVRIVDQNGQRYATVSYQGQEYTVQEGDQIANSPFKVTDIGDGSISLLYGDDRLTLQLGDEIVK